MGIYEEKRAELKALCDQFEDFDGFKFSREKFDEFYISGSRLVYENEYFARRGCLMARAADAIINRDGESSAGLAEIIEAVCDEPTWALPAHVARDTKMQNCEIDLFSAETAQTLCEISHYVRLPAGLCGRIHDLVRERVVEPYEKKEFWWEKSAHNWAAVCSGCVGMVYLYEFSERFAAVKERVLGAMNCFLSGYGADGACLEGLGYWAYGFGYFVYFAELLRRFDGTDLFRNEKICKIAEFCRHMFMKNGVCVSFSDGFRNGSFNIGLACFCQKEFGRRAEIPDLKYRRDYDECYRFAPYLRSFLWLDEGTASGQDSIGYKYFDDAQWYVNRRKKFAFAAKGGNNAEPHNHNDVGCFIISGGSEQLIADYGAGEYTRGYFIDESRYEYFCASSAGHSVPIIDGSFQKNGETYGAEIISADAEQFILDISGAYGLRELTGLTREFKIYDNKVTLRDTFKLCGKKATERLVSLIKPEIANGDTKIKNMTIKSDSIPVIGSVTVKNHGGAEETVYTIDYEVNSGEFECEFIFP